MWKRTETRVRVIAAFACSIAVLCLFIYCITLLYDTIWCQCNDFVIVGACVRERLSVAHFIEKVWVTHTQHNTIALISTSILFALHHPITISQAPPTRHSPVSPLFYWCGAAMLFVVAVVTATVIVVTLFFLSTVRISPFRPKLA